jgi:pyruvate kinase
MTSSLLCHRGTRATKIIATLGPASTSAQVIEALARAGADVFRLNFSHGTHEQHQQRFAAVRAAEAAVGRPLAVMADLQGPKIRLGAFAGGHVDLTPGQTLRLDAEASPGDARRVGMPHREVLDALALGDSLLVDDGKLRFTVIERAAHHVIIRAVNGGTLHERKGVSLPQSRLPISALTPKDEEDLAFALALGVDWVALSFVQSAADVRSARRLVQQRARVLAKIEKPASLDDLEAIVECADALMVARGDLGVELPPEAVPVVQRRIVRACRRAGKPVVVATQMLESMINVPVPTRAEASDVATAVYEGVDAVMLSAESAAGDYPVEAVTMMDRIVRAVEADALRADTVGAFALDVSPSAADAIGAAVRTVAAAVPLVATVTYTTSGASALRVAHQRPLSPLIGLTPLPSTARALAMTWGVIPRLSDDARDVEEMVQYARDAVVALGLDVSSGPIVIVAGIPFGHSGSTNLMRLVWPQTEA